MVNRISFNQGDDFNELVKTTVGLIEQAKNRNMADKFIPTYFEELDQKIDGLEKGKITAIVGRPSMGKTLFALNIIRRVVDVGTSVLVLTLSKCKEDWTECFLCSSTNLNLHKVRTGFLNEEETGRLKETSEKLSTLPIYVKDDKRRLEGIIKAISESIKENMVELVLIDGMSNIYGNHLQTQKGRGKRYEKQLKILKEKAEEWNIPVLITQGLSRRTERNPYLLIPKHEYGIKEGNLYQYASRILQLYREEYYNPKKNNRGVMDIRIPAMKFAEPDFNVRVHFDRETGLIKEYESIPFDPEKG